MNNMKEDLEKLLKLAYDAGYIYACWCDGAHVSTEHYHKSETDLEAATKAFLEKYDDNTSIADEE